MPTMVENLRGLIVMIYQQQNNSTSEHIYLIEGASYIQIIMNI